MSRALPVPARATLLQKIERRSPFGWREAALTLLIVFLAYQVVIPLVMIVWTSLKTARPGLVMCPAAGAHAVASSP